MNRTALIESYLATGNVGEALRELNSLFRLDVDFMRCRRCRNCLVITQRHEPFPHERGCPYEHEAANPWELLTKALNVGRESAAITALHQAVRALEMLCDSANPATADKVTDAQLANAVNEAIEDGNAALWGWGEKGITHGS